MKALIYSEIEAVSGGTDIIKAMIMDKVGFYLVPCVGMAAIGNEWFGPPGAILGAMAGFSFAKHVRATPSSLYARNLAFKAPMY